MPVALAGCLVLASCEREMQDMYRQPRFDPNEPSTLFDDGRASRPSPSGSVAMARGTLAMTSSGRRGERAAQAGEAANAAMSAGAPTMALLERGRERFEIVCSPCHSVVGDGDGTVVRRGFPRPPSYHQERLRNAPDRHFFDVITNGYGVMYAYADRVAPEDRWAIVAYIRALQLSQHAELARLPAALQAELVAALPALSTASSPVAASAPSSPPAPTTSPATTSAGAASSTAGAR
ncbi:MAG: cytochrome c [Rhizobacter sp.]|nr:cytochrome c [Rhizobacter sp.]